jgi:phosphoribosylformimino-5-aminoimidazole carboxamide ribotide isomerase
MIILPAIDIKDGQCVRLYKGDFNTAQKVAPDPLETALRFQEAGASWLHMVDLDGACLGQPVNQKIFLEIAQKTKLKVELGGGIRDLETIDYYLAHGIARVILGTAAMSNPELIRKAISRYKDKIAVGIDARDEKVMVDGWLESSGRHYIDAARAMSELGVEYLIFTDISKDGTLNGPNLNQLQAVQEAADCRIIASGGIHNIHDIRNLTAMGLYGAICGQSIYKGTLDLREALSAANNDIANNNSPGRD